MAITGLPNPDIHRKCKRCHQWFEHHEVDLVWPPKVGLLSWVHVTLSENADLTKEQKYYCRPCQELNLKAESKFRKQTYQGLAMAVLLLIALLIAWALGAGDVITKMLKR